MRNDQQRKHLAIYLLMACVLVHVVGCLPEIIRVAAFFGDDELEPSVENAFKYAIYRLNHDRTILPNTKIVYDVQRIPSDDSFRASKKVCSKMQLGLVAVFGPRNHAVASYVNSMCHQLKVPHMECRMEARYHSSGRQSFGINLYPDPQQLGQAFIDVIKHFKWKKILVIYGDKDALLRIQPIIRAPVIDDMEVTVRQVNALSMRVVLKEAQQRRLFNIIADLSTNHTHLLLKMALQEGMIDAYHHYLLANLDTETIDMNDYRHNYVNLTAFRLVNPNRPDTARILQDIEIYELQTDLKLLNRSGLISHEAALMYDSVFLLARALEDMDRHSQLTVANLSCEGQRFWDDGEALFNYIEQVEMDGLTGHIQLQRGMRLNFKLDILDLHDTGLHKIGDWSLQNPLELKKTYYGAGLGAFGNKTLSVTSILPRPYRVTTLLEPPYVMMKESDKPLKGNKQYKGFCIELLEEIAKICGFTYEIRLVEDDTYGSINEKGEWNGLVRELIDHKADLAVASLTINYPREQVIDFTKPFLNLGISILYKVSIREKPGLFSFLNPLALEIWLYVIVAFLTVSFTLFILSRFSPYEWYSSHVCSNGDSAEVENAFTLCNSFWFTVGTLMQQGSDISPRAISTRILGGIWWFFTLIIISSYTANLAAFLTVERMVSPISSAEDLADQTEIAYGSLAGGSTMMFFKNSTIDTYIKMWQFMVAKEPTVFTKSNNEGITRVMEENGKYAFLMESPMMDYNIRRNCTKLMQVGGLLDSKGYGIGTPMNSPIRDQMSLAILELQENGKIHQLYEKWWKSDNPCTTEGKKGSKALGVENVGGIFVVLLAGLSLAVIVAIIEFIWHSRRSVKQDGLKSPCGSNVAKQPICAEMAEELRFAIRCHGSTKKPRFKRTCSKCKSRRSHVHEHDSQAYAMDSPNGTIQLRDVRNSKKNKVFEYDYKPPDAVRGREFSHVEYSDQEC